MPSLRFACIRLRPLGQGAFPGAVLLAAALWLGVPQMAAAQEPPAAVAMADVVALSAVLRIDDVFAVMRDEGVEYGETLDADMLGGGGGSAWRAKVSEIYDPAAMTATFNAALVDSLAQNAKAAQAATDFFAAPLGQRVIGLEIDARRALLDDFVEDAAQLAWAEMDASDDPRAALLRRFAEVNDLVDSNVTGALNSNLAFYRGLGGAGALGDMPQDELLAEVWAQEDAVRAETEEWLFPYLALAYRPLSDADLTAYTDFSATPDGQVLNRALFGAFAVVFEGISERLGAAAALQMQGQDI